MDPPDRMPQDIRYFEETVSSIMELIGPTDVVQLIINNDNYDDGGTEHNIDNDSHGDSDKVSETKDMLSRKYHWIY